MKPILCTKENVRAIIDLMKTQTRRVINPQLRNPNPDIKGIYFDSYNNTDLWEWWGKDNRIYGTEVHSRKCPFGAPGDQLWVKESYIIQDFNIPSKTIWGHYTADLENFKVQLADKQWRLFNMRERKFGGSPARFMYKAMARIILEIKDIRVEKLQDISDADVLAEGLLETDFVSFAGLWDSINKKKGYSFDTNPDVWVVEFEKIKEEQVRWK